jgi:hypothetical protein
MSESTAPGAVAPDQAEIATARSDPRRWHYGERIENDDPIIRSRGAAKGLDLYDEIERDPQVGCELGKRRMALLGREWRIDAGAADPRAERARDLVERALKAARFNQAVEKLLDAVLKGLAVVEVMWVMRGGEVMPAELRGRDPMRFRAALPPDGAPPPAPEAAPPAFVLRLLTRSAPTEGVPLPARKFVAHRFGARYENPWGLGLGSRLFWPVFFKRQGIGSAATPPAPAPTTRTSCWRRCRRSRARRASSSPRAWKWSCWRRSAPAPSRATRSWPATWTRTSARSSSARR